MNRAKFCYPTPTHNISLCKTIVRELENYDPSIFSAEYYTKGTDSVIFRPTYGIVLKIARVDRKIDLLREGKALFLINSMLEKYSFAPKIYCYTEHTVLEEFIEGKTLHELVSENSLTIDMIAKMIKNAALLDVVKIRHNELSRPFKHIIVRKRDGNPFFIDFASSTIGKSGNLTQLVSALLLSKSIIGTYIRNKLLIDEKKSREILRIMREYKEKIKNKEVSNEQIFSLLGKLSNVIGIKII
jgi:putative serine/threonine protein kinase